MVPFATLNWIFVASGNGVSGRAGARKLTEEFLSAILGRATHRDFRACSHCTPMIMGRHLEIAAPFLRHFLKRFWEKHALDPDKILTFLNDDSIFPKERLYVVRKGLESYAAGEAHVASCVLLPELEVALRRLLHSQAGWHAGVRKSVTEVRDQAGSMMHSW
jgi:hypothetical protein